MECLIFDHYFVFSTADCWLLLEKLDCCWLWLEKLNTPYFALAAVFLYLAPGSGDWTLRNEALPWDGLEGKRALTVVKGGGSKVPYIFNKITIKQNNLTPFSPSGSCCSKAFARGGGGAGPAFPHTAWGREGREGRGLPGRCACAAAWSRPPAAVPAAADWRGGPATVMEARTALTFVRGGPALSPSLSPPRGRPPTPPPGGNSPQPSPCTAHSAPAAASAAPPASSPVSHLPAPPPLAGARRCAPPW